MDILWFLCTSFHRKLDLLTGLLKCHYCNLPAFHINRSPQVSMVTLDLWPLLSLCRTSWKVKYERAAKMKGCQKALSLQQKEGEKKESEKAVSRLSFPVILILITHLCLDCITHWITGNYSPLDTVLESGKSFNSHGILTSISILLLAYRDLYFIRY